MIGAVLAGGAAARFGSDKAVADWLGIPLASRPMRALYGAGAKRLVYVAAQPRDDETFVLPPGAHPPVHVVDDHPGEGPLGAIVTVLRWSQSNVPEDDTVVIAACDLPNLTSTVVASMMHRLSTSNVDIVVPRAGGRVHWSLLALRRSSCIDVLAAEFARGERAVHRAVATLERFEIEMDTEAVVNVNERNMLPISSPNR